MAVQLSVIIFLATNLKIFLVWNHQSTRKYQKCIKCLKPFFWLLHTPAFPSIYMPAYSYKHSSDHNQNETSPFPQAAHICHLSPWLTGQQFGGSPAGHRALCPVQNFHRCLWNWRLELQAQPWVRPAEKVLLTKPQNIWGRKGCLGDFSVQALAQSKGHQEQVARGQVQLDF